MTPSLLKPIALKPGDTIGVFTPSSPAYVWNEELFVNGLRNLEKCGFKTKLGTLTANRSNQGYRSASPQDRADEFMSLILDPEVHGLMSTIGGSNSSSMLPYLDFKAIRDSRKIICGYSDVTSLHMAVLTMSGLSTFYGPAVMCWFGEWPDGIPESTNWFLDAVMNHKSGERPVRQPDQWSNHKRNWENGDWKKLPRQWQQSGGWNVLTAGAVEAPILALNLNTMLCLAGTKYWPDFAGTVLLIEDMDAPQSHTERSLRQLSLMGVFDKIVGLIVSKPEIYEQQGAPFGYDELIMEVVGKQAYPIVSNFDCGHTVPMLTIPQLSTVRLTARRRGDVEFTFLDGAVY